MGIRGVVLLAALLTSGCAWGLVNILAARQVVYVLYDRRACRDAGTETAVTLATARTLRTARRQAEGFGAAAIYAYDVDRDGFRHGERWIEDHGC
jgi:hypothetical protein